MQERTLVLIKPDAYRRGLTGEILGRFERAGLRIHAIRVSIQEQKMIDLHYPSDDEWLRVVGGKTLSDYTSLGKSTNDILGTDDARDIGRIIRARLVTFLASGPMIVVAIDGNRAVENVRKIVGGTLPVNAAPGTIRGDFSVDSTDLANEMDRPVENLIHASGDKEEAAREIALWFPNTVPRHDAASSSLPNVGS